MKLKPLSDRVVVEPISEEDLPAGKAGKTKSGIIIPDTIDKEKPEQGKVIAVGPGKILADGKRAAMSVKIGDKIVFKKYGPDEVKVGDKEYLIISEEDILAILG